MADEWYRKTTWGEADQADFFAHLKKSRDPGNKAQYLRVQAACLEEVGTPEFLKAAITLLDKMLAEFPELVWLAMAYGQKASCLAKLGDPDQAVVNYRLALGTERKFPNSRTQALNDFGMLVVEKKMTQLYDEALAVLDEMKLPGTEFPSDVYKSNGIRAVIAAHKGETERARQFARLALKAAALDHSGFRYHPTFGLVKDRESRFFRAIEALVASDVRSFAN
jgi:tetratricopeptide (TPR) repeat protein